MNEHDAKCERDPETGFFLCHCSKRRREARGLTEVPTDPLDFPPPDCPACDQSLYHDGDGWRCDNCALAWDGSGQRPHFVDDFGPDLAERAARHRERNLSAAPARSVGETGDTEGGTDE